MRYEENQSFEYARVYILDNPYFIDGTYDYFIPYSMRGEIGRGCFVTVPFGRSNRKQMALVAELVHAPDFKDTKPLDSVCDDRSPLSEEMMRLVLFMKEQVLCTVGEAVRCVVPAAAIGKMEEYYYPMPVDGPDSTSGYTPSELYVYEYLVSCGGKTIEALKSRFGAAVATEAVEKLYSKGFLGKELIVGKTSREAFENYYSLAISRDEAEAILSGTSEIKLRSGIHKAIIAALLRSDSPLSAQRLRQDCSAGTTQF